MADKWGPYRARDAPDMVYGPSPRWDQFAVKTSTGELLAYATCTMMDYLRKSRVVTWCKLHRAYHCDDPEALASTIALFEQAGIQ